MGALIKKVVTRPMPADAIETEKVSGTYLTPFLRQEGAVAAFGRLINGRRRSGILSRSCSRSPARSSTTPRLNDDRNSTSSSRLALCQEEILRRVFCH
jgi:hypothetical protein